MWMIACARLLGSCSVVFFFGVVVLETKNAVNYETRVIDF